LSKKILAAFDSAFLSTRAAKVIKCFLKALSLPIPTLKTKLCSYLHRQHSKITGFYFSTCSLPTSGHFLVTAGSHSLPHDRRATGLPG